MVREGIDPHTRIQLNWVADDKHKQISLWRHRLSAFMKGLKRGQ